MPDEAAKVTPQGAQVLGPDPKGRGQGDAGIYPMNRTEQGYLALHGLAGSVNQPYLMRLNQPVDEARVRSGFRRLVSAHPRLRMIAEPGLHVYHFRVLPDDEIVDQLFDQAYRVVNHVDLDDPAAVEAFHTLLVNESLAIERSLPMRARWVPHARSPLLVLDVHHMMLDGRSLLQLLSDLMRWLNGNDIDPVPMQAPSLLPTIAPLRWFDWPRKLLAARRHARREAQLNRAMPAVQLPTRMTPNYSTHALVHGRLSVSAPRLKARARELKVSLNTFLTALLAEAFLRLQAEDPHSAAVIRLSADLRRYYPGRRGPVMGNYVGAFMVREHERGLTFEQRVQSIDAQVAAALKRFDDREMCWAYLFEEAVGWMGRTLTSHIAWQVKRKGRFPRISAHATSLAGAGKLINARGAAIRALEVWPMAPSISLLIGLVEMEDVILLPTSFQRCETDPQAVRAFLQHLDDVALDLVGPQMDAAPQA